MRLSSVAAKASYDKLKADHDADAAVKDRQLQLSRAEAAQHKAQAVRGRLPTCVLSCCLGRPHLHLPLRRTCAAAAGPR
jgi:hypothetical protein